MNYKSQRASFIPFSPVSLKQLSKMHPSLWMQEDFYEIRASFALREIPMDKPAYVITFRNTKNDKGHLSIENLT